MAEVIGGVARRIVLSYAGVVAATLLLLGPILYLSFSQQIAASADAALRLAAQRQAALALAGRGVQVGINPHFAAPRSLAQQDTFYLLLTPTGQVRDNPERVAQRGLPDRAAVRQAVQTRGGVFSTLATTNAGPIRLVTVPLLRNQRVVALVQAGRSLATVDAARHTLLLHLLGLGALVVVAATIGGYVLTRQALRPAHAAYAAQRAFVADASHELRTPLTLLRTNADLLQAVQAVPRVEDQGLLADIVSLTDRMDQLITDLLTLARLDAGVGRPALTPVALDAVVATSVRPLAMLAARRDIALQVGVLEPTRVRGDAKQLAEVVTILVSNAIAYNRPGGTVAVTLQRLGSDAVLRVRDTGYGIPAADLPRIFDRFQRGARTRQLAAGSGLGLAIAQRIVRAHRGRISATSELEVGSVFTVALPLADGRAPSAKIR